MRIFKRFVNSFRSRGLHSTWCIAKEEISGYFSDRIQGLDTNSMEAVAEFKTGSANKIHATQYQPTRTKTIMKLFNQLNIPKEGAFVDVGAGKGRVLLLANSLGFKTVRGIEFCENLSEVAKKNIQRHLARNGSGGSIEVITCDATSYEFRGDESVLYLYNPFNETVLRGFMDALAQELTARPRKMWLIYQEPLHSREIDRTQSFSLSDRMTIHGSDFAVYSR